MVDDGKNRLILGVRLLFASLLLLVCLPVRAYGLSGVSAPPPDRKVITLQIGVPEITVNGAKQAIDAAPYIEKEVGRTMAPVRYIGEAMGCEVHWLPETRQVKVEGMDKSFLITISSNHVTVNGQIIYMECPPEVVDSRTMVPLRYFCEELGATVDWDSSAMKVTITVN